MEKTDFKSKKTSYKPKKLSYKSKIFKPWKKSDFAKTILQFFAHTLVIILLFTGAVAITHGGRGGFVKFFTETRTRLNFIYISLAVAFLISMVYLYFYCEFRDFIKKGSNIFLVFSILEFSVIISFLMGLVSKDLMKDTSSAAAYARPVAMCALLILLLVNRRAAIVMNITYSLIMFMIDSFIGEGPEIPPSAVSSMLIGITTGLFAIYLVSNVTSRLKVLLMGIPISIPIIICVLCFEFDAISLDPSFARVMVYIGAGFTSGMLSVVLMMAFVPLFEQLFNIVTDYRLSELTDHNSKLIRALRSEATGTFNHSLTVSILAESCAAAIGENPLLARAAAYYHDIGKLKQPEYFSENVTGRDPHSELSPELSTDIIKMHTKDGYDLIKKYHLPQILADIALEHHGTLPIKYFYAKALKYTEGELDIADFSYPGPRPQTKISAIIMISDGCEAAVRALPERTMDKVDQVVKSIIEERMDMEQFNECPLTMRDLDIIRSTISQSLGGVYHDRVKYPKLKIGKSRR